MGPTNPNNLDHGEAYWFGSDDLARYMPHMLIKQLGLMEKYWSSWLYSADARKDRINKWMDRGKKSQLPCAQGMNGVSSPDGLPGLDSYVRSDRMGAPHDEYGDNSPHQERKRTGHTLLQQR